MTANLRDLNAHLTALHQLTDSSSQSSHLSRRPVASLLASSLRMLAETALPREGTTVKLQSQNHDQLTVAALRERDQPTLRQQRHEMYQSIEQLMTELDGVNYSAWDALSEPDRQRLGSIHQTHSNLADDIQRVVEGDVDPVRFHTWAQSEMGRKALARAVALAREEHGDNQKEVRETSLIASKREFLSEFYNYLSSQFPSNQPDESRPTLSMREALIHARQTYDAMASQNNNKSGIPMEDHLNQALVGGQNTLRYNLPAVEGIATPQYWRQWINNNFESAEQVPNVDNLLSFGLQDRLPASEVISALKANLTSQEINAASPTIRYLDGIIFDDQYALVELGKSGRNDILVLDDEDGEPIIATAINPHPSENVVTTLPNILVVTAPGRRHQIVPVSDNELENTPTQAEKRKDLIRTSAANLEHRAKPDAVEDRLSAIHGRWRDLISNAHEKDVDTLQSKLKGMTKELRDTAKSIVAPGFGNEAQGINARRLVRLALLIDPGNAKREKWQFRTPDSVSTRSQSHPPGVIITGEETQSDGKATLHFDLLSEQGERLNKPVKLRDISSTGRYRVAAYAALRINPENPSVGKENPEFKGLMTVMLSEEKKIVSTGHWLHPDDYRSVTEFSPLGLTYKDGQGTPLFADDMTARSEEEVHKLMDATVYLLHGSLLEPDNAVWAAEIASYDGDFMLSVDMGDLAGAPKIQVHETVFQTASLEDIKRHLIQKVATSDFSREESVDMRERIKAMSWDQARRGIETAFEEHELLLEAAPGL